MIDLNRSMALIKGAVFDTVATWDAYFSDAGDWKKTLFVLTGPLIIGSALIAFILSLVFRGSQWRMPVSGIGGLLLDVINMSIGAALVALIVSVLAGLFKGKASFPKALAATSLAFVPGYMGHALAPLPWIGPWIGFGLFVYSLVLLYQVLPKYMELPDSARVGHYVLTILAAIVAGVLLTFVFGALGLSRTSDDLARDSGRIENNNGSPSGMFGGMERAGRIMDEAENDEYDPPSNNKLSKAQVKQYVNFMVKTKALMTAQTKDLKDLSERADNDKTESLGEIFSGLGNVMQLTTAEMEVVKTGGGNWAEHQWIKEQLRVAMIHKDSNSAVKHNYELYQEFEQQLRDADR